MNIDREFIKWFYEDEYPDLGCNRREVYGRTQADASIDVVDYWMREAFRAGAQATLDKTEINALQEFEAFNINRNYPL